MTTASAPATRRPSRSLFRLEAATAARAAEAELRVQLADLEDEDFWERFFASPAAIVLHCAMLDATGGSTRGTSGRRPSLRAVLRDPQLCRAVHDRVLGQRLAGEARPSWRRALVPPPAPRPLRGLPAR